MTNPLILRGLAILCVFLGISGYAWYGLPWLRWVGFAELARRRRMKKEGLFIPWEEVRLKLEKGEGKLVCNRSEGHHGWFWFWPKPNYEPPALLTDCPLRYYYLKRLRKEFPKAKIEESHPF